jgi:tRNA A-37 threonylcarbamoyl transferase component Bud32
VFSILRLLPGKRVVFRANLDGRLTAIKFFVKNRSSARHIQREQAGYERVRAAGVLCPKLIGHCVSECARFEGLIYEFINDATELAQAWPQLDTPQKSHWLRQVVMATLQLHHRVGAYQEDIHLGNFLIQDEQLYLLDLGSIVIRNAPLPQAQCLANLGQLVAQLNVGEQLLLDAPIEQYFAQCGWHNTATLKNILQNAARGAWRYRLRDYLGKAQRDCSLTCFEKTPRRVFAFRRTWQCADLQRFADDPDRFMAGAQLLKAGNTATVVKAMLDGKPVVIKRYNIKNWRHAASRSLRATRAEHSWHYAHLLELAGIDSLKPIALLERRCGPLRSTAYFICSWIDAPDLLAVGAQRALHAEELEALTALLLQMTTCRISHGDFKANNLLVRAASIAVIDLDAMQQHRSPRIFRRAFDRDLARLLRNWSEGSMARSQVEIVVAKVAAKLTDNSAEATL